MSKLIIRLHYNSDSYSWQLLGNDGSLIESHDGDLSVLSTGHQIEETWLIVPGYDVLVTTLNVPEKLRRKQFAKSVPFALEEKLGEDIESLHFAIANKYANDRCPVAIVKKRLINQWQDMFAQFNIYLTAICPDYLLLPYLENQWTVFTNEQFSLVRMDECTGYTVENEILLQMINAHVADENVRKPEVIRLINKSEQLLFDENKLKTVNISIQNEENAENIVSIRAASLDELPFNLLQGQYEIKRPNQIKRTYKIAASVAASFLLCSFVGYHVINYYSYQHQLEGVTQQLKAVYHEIYPTSKQVDDPRAEMQAELNSLQKLQQKNQFLQLLLLVGENLSPRNKMKIETIEYRNNALMVNLELTSFEGLDEVSQRLKEKGLVVKREYARTADKMIKARLNISRSAS